MEGNYIKMKIETILISHIIPYEDNPRKNKNAIDKVAASIKEFGFKQPIVVDRDGVIIAGHTRHKAAIQLGLTEVPVLSATDLTDAQVKAYRLADNKTAEFSEWDTDLLFTELGELKVLEFDMELFGFDLMDEHSIKDDGFDVEGALEEIKKPVSKLGDKLYKLLTTYSS